MALFRLPLSLKKKISFWKLLGCGKNGTFDIHPDWNQWAILTVNGQWSMVNETSSNNYKLIYGSFISWWWKFFNCEMYTVILQPIEGHGTWDKKKIFGELAKQTNHVGMLAVLTRATVR